MIFKAPALSKESPRIFLSFVLLSSAGRISASISSGSFLYVDPALRFRPRLFAFFFVVTLSQASTKGVLSFAVKIADDTPP
ncbi:unnamed protein product [Haemonchus placei]|uniref:Uncharacterized protein n=1 Tax=Haemonchus placei TaxID=6290 RepID=A0A3P7W7E1_HAEPC|nr:unnamed protein product [Haemonchus placei]